MVLTGGQADAGDPEAQLVGVVAVISMLSGVNVHEARLGSPEQESVMNIGDARLGIVFRRNCDGNGARITGRHREWQGGRRDGR